jgi:peptide chain release factor 3
MMRIMYFSIRKESVGMPDPFSLQEEVKKRRTFAIISHPDAGKTTLTEKLLLYGGAIHLAGSVKARKASKYAVSDWMEIEKQRGISVTSSAMQFDYEGVRVNILDTPGHQDFSEDTYRTLMAADSAVMLIDGAKGVEPQTIKLFHVCRMRGIPIFTFVNKMDRASRDPFDLMGEIESVLGMHCAPINWPIGTEGDFKGIYHRDRDRVELFLGDEEHGAKRIGSVEGDPRDPGFTKRLGEYHTKKLMDDLLLLEGAGEGLDMPKVLAGQLSPMFFGSAMNNFGVQCFLERFLAMAPGPSARFIGEEVLEPENPEFTAFVFKIQANMNPAHRDRIAFLRVCSGKFTKGMDALNVNSSKFIRLAQPQQFMAQEREAVEEAWPGDIIGIFDPGVFHIGDTLTEGSTIKFEGIPMFAPEHFARVASMDSMKRKQFLKGVSQLSEEGAVQVFRRLDIGRQELVVGVVGQLQFDVLAFRLQGEYGVELRIEGLPYRFVRWVSGAKDLAALNLTSSTLRAADAAGRPVLLFENTWSINWAEEHNKELKLEDTATRVWEMEQ